MLPCAKGCSWLYAYNVYYVKLQLELGKTRTPVQAYALPNVGIQLSQPNAPPVTREYSSASSRFFDVTDHGRANQMLSWI